MKPSITIISISLHIASLKSGTAIEFGRNSGDVIPPRNINIVGLSGRGISYFANRSVSCHGAANSESENSEGERIFKNYGHENNFEVEEVGRKNFIIFNHVHSNHIKTNSNHVDLNHANSNRLITAN